MRGAALALLALGGCAAKTEPWSWQRWLAVLVGALGLPLVIVAITLLVERWRR